MSEFCDPYNRDLNDVVELLEQNGISILSSCTGGEAQAFKHPTILIKQQSDYLDEDQIVIAKILSENEYIGYYIKLVYAYQGEAIPWASENHNGIEIEFWPPSFEGEW